MKRLLFAFILLTAVLLPLSSTPADATNSSKHIPFKIPHTADVPGIANSRTGKIKVYFSPVKWVKNITYMITYNSDGVPQGISGSFDPNGKLIVIKDFFMGTCSGTECVKHKKITKVKVEATFEYNDGVTKTKKDKLTLF